MSADRRRADSARTADRGQSDDGHETGPPLTLRQRQILDLLQAGKVNKEIADELGIGVGTVKQHVVALFKRLNVRNRAMAVSRGLGMRRDHDDASVAMVSEGMLERRPSVVLSMLLPEEAKDEAVRCLHGTLARLAAESDALFIARKGGAGDVIFGIQRIAEDDIVKALRAAHVAFTDMSSHDVSLACDMRAGLTAGLAVVSMRRHGGWSGEAIASEAIALARDLQRAAPPGHVMLGSPALDLIRAMGIGDGVPVTPEIPFRRLESLKWTGERSSFALVGRDAEMKWFDAALRDVGRGVGKAVVLTSEAGMGKSRLCRELFQMCVQRKGLARYFRCLPAEPDRPILDISDMAAVGTQSPADLEDLLRSNPARSVELVVIDDFHLLAEGWQPLLCAAAAAGAAMGRMVVLSSRRRACLAEETVEHIHLRRLPMNAIVSLVQETLSGQNAKIKASSVRSLSRMAAGVPLFAIELALRHGTHVPALALLVVVCARLDGLRLDHKILRFIARGADGVTSDEVARGMGEDMATTRESVRRMIAAGVILSGQDERLAFTHPLIRRVIEQLSLE